ncbi:hypothetical protein KQI41_02765 [Tissierella pigra]|uniref:hypothetical protein n=1 Tax=Tissierella pigra TaxID=2607614 RepID=UPI001C0F6927|nr:hypothetical protein [Tissierella pigra]MBU5425324.1 hypothetical protein [Tissierella pigra]
MEYRIEVRNHWWFDGGIAGLYFVADRIKKEENYNIDLSFDSDGLTIGAEDEEKIREFLESCYSLLASLYWNVSTKSQKDKLELVMYDEETKEFSLAPRRQPTPVVGKFVKGTSWKAHYIEYEDMDDILKGKTDDFTKENKRSLWGGKKNRLLFSLPECQPDVKILPKENIKKQLTCSVCGKLTSNLSEISQPSFLLFASKSAAQSFHTQGNKAAKICWECELLSKFTMDTINYKKDGSTLSILLLNSPNLEHNINNQKKIGSSSVLRSIDNDYFYKNIGFEKDSLINKSRMSYELLWAYFVDTYSVLKSNTVSIETDGNDIFAELLGDIISNPIEIVVIALDEMGQTFITKELIFYNDVSYAYRLIDCFFHKSLDLKNIYNALFEKDNKNNPKPSRNNILRKILNKHCILTDIESLTLRKVYDNKFINVSNMLDFLIEYYLIIKEDIMNREQIDVAVKLGKQIVNQAYRVAGEDKNILKKIKGDLFTLRKTRTVTDFIIQLNTLQFRYGISVSNSILEGILNEVPFEDFKGYCIMGALNSYNFFNSNVKDKGENEDE